MERERGGERGRGRVVLERNGTSCEHLRALFQIFEEGATVMQRLRSTFGTNACLKEFDVGTHIASAGATSQHEEGGDDCLRRILCES